MNKTTVLPILVVSLCVTPAFSQAKNVILLISDGAGISRWNAASISGYDKPQTLYVQKMGHLADQSFCLTVLAHLRHLLREHLFPHYGGTD
jgi:alkaline phosphatase